MHTDLKTNSGIDSILLLIRAFSV